MNVSFRLPSVFLFVLIVSLAVGGISYSLGLDKGIRENTRIETHVVPACEQQSWEGKNLRILVRRFNHDPSLVALFAADHFPAAIYGKDGGAGGNVKPVVRSLSNVDGMHIVSLERNELVIRIDDMSREREILQKAAGILLSLSP